jgi:NAD(P)-dependent dehydrogenase (short-subunit alcohol dehydrogenase family)
MAPQPQLQVRSPTDLDRLFLTQAQWQRSTDASELLQHAAPLIPRQYLTLILCEVVELALPHWTRMHPDDWRPAWCLAAARAWCLGEASAQEVHDARVAGISALRVWNPQARQQGTSSAAAYCAAKAAVLATAYAWDHDDGRAASEIAEGCLFWAAAAHSAEGEQAVQSFFRDGGEPVGYGKETAEAEELAQERLHDERLAELAGLVRELLPYPSRPVRRWEVGAGRASAGQVVVELDGGRIHCARVVAGRSRGRSGGLN